MRPDLADIHYAGERAANLTRQLLAFSRQQVLQPEKIDLNEVITNTQAMLQRLIGEDVRLTTELTTGVPPIWADSGQVEQIIFNLAVNARDAMPNGGTLTIATSSETLDEDQAKERVGLEAGDYVILRISDTGTGMDESVQARIFEPFFTTKPTGQGTGLGLATVFGIVQQSGGHIAVQSVPQRGTSFEIYLPQAEHAAPVQFELAPGITSAADAAETLLLVEDDSGVRNVARRVLSEFGYRVLEAVDGIDALRVWHEQNGNVDLVITDVVMPGMGGQELVKRLAELRPDTKVLYVSGYTDSSALRAGFTDTGPPLLRKPFTATSLADKVREILDAPA
jgi:CheY-like chemotaxis protein